jgi:NADPH:quinone reductase-like Zn-dependent oxidoreductase
MECEATNRAGKIVILLVRKLLEEGLVVPVIDRRYPLREVLEALRYLEAEHAKGKVVIMVQQHTHT